MTEHVIVSRPEPPIARLTIDRPAKRNALSIQVRNEMSDALDELADDEGVSVVVIDSVGPVFSAGFDLAEFDDPSAQEALWASSDRWHETLRSHPLPLVAAVQGPALAGGFDLATMCDLRVAARSATFRRPELAWGVAIYSILADLVGGAVARELSMTQRELGAEEALAMHLVTQVVDDAELAEASLRVARGVAACDRGALLHAKAMAIAHANGADGRWGW
ncbi:MAG: enoyl-CoA hydratase/isomerase family protein [Microthrixaceae bacterium]